MIQKIITIFSIIFIIFALGHVIYCLDVIKKNKTYKNIRRNNTAMMIILTAIAINKFIQSSFPYMVYFSFASITIYFLGEIEYYKSRKELDKLHIDILNQLTDNLIEENKNLIKLLEKK